MQYLVLHVSIELFSMPLSSVLLPPLSCFLLGTAAPYPKGVFIEAIASLVCAVTAVIVTCVLAVIGFLLYRRKRRRSHEQYIAPCQLQQPLVSVRTLLYFVWSEWRVEWNS